MIDLNKPFVFIDIESTGVDFKRKNCQIIQLSAIKVDMKENKIIDVFDTYVQPSVPYTIELCAYLVHKITPKMLENAPSFEEVGPKFLEFVKDCVLVGHNIYLFDLPFIVKELYVKCNIDWDISKELILDTYLEERKKAGNDLDKTFQKYCEKTMEEAGLEHHNSLSDCKASYAILKHQLEENPDMNYETVLSNDGSLVWGEFDGKYTAVFSTGKYWGIPAEIVVEYDPMYINRLLCGNVAHQLIPEISDNGYREVDPICRSTLLHIINMNKRKKEELLKKKTS